MNYFQRTAFFVPLSLALAGCSTLPATGPSHPAVLRANGEPVEASPIQVQDVTEGVARRMSDDAHRANFATSLGDGLVAGAVVGRGDIVDVSIWEAPPAALFGTMANISELSASAGPSTSRGTVLPEQIVGTDGAIRVPFAGAIPAAGRSPQQIAADIRTRLQGKAHDPQVIVRLARNSAANATVVGEVANSQRIPLTAKGERLLDALAMAGGVRQPVGKMTIQVTRGDAVEAMALETVIKDPRQNIRLQAEDVVTLLFQPYSFTVLGAANKNDEIAFEGTGLTLAQALGRIGGLQDQRANPKGVFIFRFESPKSFASDNVTPPVLTKDGMIPVIYRVDMKDPKTFFVAQSFPIKDKDLIYVSNAPLADFSKFLQAVSQIVYPIATIQNTNIF